MGAVVKFVEVGLARFTPPSSMPAAMVSADAAAEARTKLAGTKRAAVEAALEVSPPGPVAMMAEDHEADHPEHAQEDQDRE
jgi:hypothetical protein